MEVKVKTYNLIILDKSGSMDRVRQVTLDGLNEQLQSIRKTQEDYPEQEQIVCFATFNNTVETDSRWNKPISEVEDFSLEDYIPNGMTALNDAIGVSITKLRDEISDDLETRSANIMVMIFTDGQENNSVTFSSENAKYLVNEVKETGMWTVSFIGCGDNVFDVAQGYGIDRGDTLSYCAGIEGTADAFSTMSLGRSVRAANYSTIYTKGLSPEEASLEVSNLNQDGHFFDNMDLDSESKTSNGEATNK